MPATAQQLFDSSEFTPLWKNGIWPPGLGWLHIGSDLAIWVACILIPCLFCYYMIGRKDVPYRRILLLCIAFLVLSGLTHLMDAALFWWPAYRLSGLLKLLTAVASWATVFALVRMTPQLLAQRSPFALEKDVAQRIRADEALAVQIELTEGLLDSTQAHVAVIDSLGVIRAVNSSWRRFAIENAGDPSGSEASFHIGKNYLETCRNCDATSCEEALQAAHGIESVLRGETESFSLIYPCHSASDIRWFSLSVTPLRKLGGAVVSHTDVTQQKLAEISAGVNVRAAVGVCMAEGGSLQQILKVCCEAILEGLGTSFVRAWTLDPTGSTLEMQCSVGLYTHIDGPHGRVPVGQFKIGKIAQTCQPLMTNSIIGDVNIPEQEWAIREKITAFAGYPLLVDGRAVGVLATFSQRPFNSVEFECLGAIADFIAEVISRKRAETSILESEARYRAAIESSPDGYWMVDDKGRLLDVNDIYAKRSGYDKQELLGMPLSELDAKESPEELAGHLAKIRHAGSDRFETIHRTKDGTGWPCEVSIAYCSLSGGRFFAFLRDISERVRAEEALRESERRFQALTRISPVGVFRTDESGNCVYVNERWCQISGISNDDALGSKWAQAIHPDDRELVFSTWTKAVSARQSFRLEYRFCDPNGEITWVLGLAVPEQTERGEIGGYVGTITDITELKRAEAQLRTSEERFRATFEQAAVGIAHVDLEGGFIWVNERFASITGHTREELLTGGFQAITHPDDLEIDLRQIGRLVAGEVPDYSLEKRYLRKLGGVVWVNLTVSLSRDAEGVPIHFISVIEDINDRKLAEEQIQRLQNDLERQVRERTAELLEAQRLAKVGSWVWHLDDNRLIWTDEIYRIFGLDSRLPAPKFADHDKFYSPESWVRLHSALQACMEKGEPFALELEVRRLDGTIGTITSQGEAEIDHTGRVVRLRGTKHDLSELRQAEAELRRVSERLQLATEALRSASGTGIFRRMCSSGIRPCILCMAFLTVSFLVLMKLGGQVFIPRIECVAIKKFSSPCEAKNRLTLSFGSYGPTNRSTSFGRTASFRDHFPVSRCGWWAPTGISPK